MAANNKCSDCGGEREPKYKNDACCKVCRYKRNRAKRDADMAAKGKRPYGSGRNPNCSKCGQPKDPSFLTSGYCRACKAEANTLKRLNARLDRGQLPLGEGRKIYCCNCGKVKETLKAGYCNACEAENDRNRRVVRKQQDPNFLQRERDKVNHKFKTNLVAKVKKDIHILTNSATRLGVIKRQPCEICNEMKVDAHHDDYNKPLDVRWLCRKHHNQHHRLHGEAILPHALIEILKERNLL